MDYEEIALKEIDFKEKTIMDFKKMDFKEKFSNGF